MWCDLAAGPAPPKNRRGASAAAWLMGRNHTAPQGPPGMGKKYQRAEMRVGECVNDIVSNLWQALRTLNPKP